MELSVIKIDGTESGKKVVLNDEIFGITPNDHAIYLDVKQYLSLIFKLIIWKICMPLQCRLIKTV